MSNAVINAPEKCGYSERINGSESKFYWCNDKNALCRYTECRFKEGSDGSKHGEVREDS